MTVHSIGAERARMTTDLIDGLASGSASGAAELPADFSTFTADDLVAWAANQLQTIDSQMHSLVARVQSNSANSSLFAQITAAVARYQTDAAAPGEDGRVLYLTDSSYNVTYHAPDGTSTPMTLRAAMIQCGMDPQTFDPTGSTAFTKTTVVNLVHMLDAQGPTMSDDSEQLSMSLQSLASRRSQITQMASQLIASLNDTASKVVGNIH